MACTVVEDACLAGTQDRHDAAIATVRRFCECRHVHGEISSNVFVGKLALKSRGAPAAFRPLTINNAVNFPEAESCDPGVQASVNFMIDDKLGMIISGLYWRTSLDFFISARSPGAWWRNNDF